MSEKAKVLTGDPERIFGISKNYFEIFLISALALFLELAVIRWLSSEVRIFAYFKNLPLMAAFLGFGLGLYLQKGFDHFPKLVCILCTIIAGAALIGITHVIFLDPRQFFILGTRFGDHAANSIPSLMKASKALLVIVSIFFLVVGVFATLTAKLGELMNKEKALKAYSINVFGSLIGILGFSLISYLHCPPYLWLLVAFAGILHFYKSNLLKALPYFAFTVFLSYFVNAVQTPIWSPYYRIDTSKTQNAHELFINYDAFQAMHDLSAQNLAKLPPETRKEIRRHYDIAYNVSARKVKSVLILGGGSGNDAAAALRAGAEQVDVVEIDPVIAGFGKNVHPEKPYASPKVHLHVDDARSFLHKTKNKYDLIVFGTLDSHVAFSSLSSLRLDNFVFTRESLQAAKAVLKEDGGVALNFFVSKDWLLKRHYSALKEVFGQDPLIYANLGFQETSLLVGKLFNPVSKLSETNYKLISAPKTSLEASVTTDDWPFLFLEKKGIPFHYVLPLALILLLSLIPLRIAKISFKQLNWTLFFTGAAFLLLETKAVTTLSLLFGSTWLVNSIVIASILFTILLANFTVGRFSSLKIEALFGGLFATLAFNYFFHFATLNSLPVALKLGMACLIISLPIFFASLIFAQLYRDVPNNAQALASNLFGSLIGGLLEYSDMLTGLNFLNVLAGILYAGALVCFLVERKNSKAALGKLPAEEQSQDSLCSV